MQGGEGGGSSVAIVGRRPGHSTHSSHWTAIVCEVVWDQNVPSANNSLSVIDCQGELPAVFSVPLWPK